MNIVERIYNTLNGKPVDRLPMIEWANYWNKTIEKWEKEGLPSGLKNYQISELCGLDKLIHVTIRPHTQNTPAPIREGGPIITCDNDYDKYLSTMYPDNAVQLREEELNFIAKEHAKGTLAVWVTVEGWFWYPRYIFGIEPHMIAFYDEPELYHRIAKDLLEYNSKVMEDVCKYFVPEFISIQEDMTYNRGPMISKATFDEFIAPYYKQFIPGLHKKGIKVFIDTDGEVTPMIPWLLETGVDGVLPLERQSGVDVNKIRSEYPDLLMIGSYDKNLMHLGEAAMREEFERLLPCMEKGGYIPSVDHQTPPDVTLKTYKMFVRILNEYCCKAVRK